MWEVYFKSVSQIVICLWTVKMQCKGKLSLSFGVLYTLPRQEVNWKIYNEISKSDLVCRLLILTTKLFNVFTYLPE